MTTLHGSGGVTASLWLDTAIPTFDAPPPSDTEVLVVGAGITGLTCAIELARRGKQVTLIDDGPIGGGETARTSAHLASAVDDRYSQLEKDFGRDGARLVAESHAAAIDYIETLARDRAIDCAFRRVDGFLFEPPGRRKKGEVQEELAAAQRAGLECELVLGTPLKGVAGPALRFANQAEFHPLRYLAGLVAYAQELGVSIHTNVHADGIEPNDATDRPVRALVRGHGPILARWAVDATNCDMTSSFQICLQQAPYRSYCIAYEVPAGTVPRALYWETGDNYHYLRVADSPRAGREIVIVGGEDHRVGQADPAPRFAALEQWARRYLSPDGEVTACWSGQIMEPVDGPAHIGASPEIPNVFVCTGDSGNGLTHGTIAGLMIPRLIDGEEVSWARIYDPKRSHTHAMGTYTVEAVRSAMPYFDWVRGGDVKSVDDIAPGCGALVRDGTQMLAVYCDDAGACHSMSAVCTHLKGIVQWNSVEKTWDCPCHGARYDAYGTVINGPALQNLAPVETPLPGAAPDPEEHEPHREAPLRRMGN